MITDTGIEWTDATWNPIRGCEKISPGCAHCYAEAFAERFRGVKGNPYEQGFDLRLVPNKLVEPLRLSKPSTIFVNSMSDLWLERVPDDYIRLVCQVMKVTPWHTYQVLTKRAERMSKGLNGDFAEYAQLDHVWWGVSVENKKHGMPRINHLRNANVKNRFLSVEPLLEDLGLVDLTGIHWVIVGAESGAGARPMKKEWVISLRDQCNLAKVPFFFKQWGGVNKKATGRVLEGRTWDEKPTWNTAPFPTQKERSAIEKSLKLIGLEGVA